MSGHSCASAWLGYEDVLFLGFGEVSFTGGRGVPEYQVETNFADWALDMLGPPGAADKEERAEQVVHSLVGRPVLGWQLLDGHGFQVEFSGRLLLRVVPMTDDEFANKEAWCVSLPGGRVVAVSELFPPGLQLPQFQFE